MSNTQNKILRNSLQRHIYIALLICMTIFIACSKHTINSKHESITQELKNPSYMLFLEAKTGTLYNDPFKQACIQGSRNACDEPSFVLERSQEELQELCIKEGKNACYTLAQHYLDMPIDENSPLNTISSSMQNAQKAWQFMQKSCDLGHARACAIAGVLMQKYFNAPQQALDLLQKSCTQHSRLGCLALYDFLQHSYPKTNDMQQQISMKLIDFGIQELCEHSSCFIDQFTSINQAQQMCDNGSGLACVSAVYLYKKEQRQRYLNDIAFQNYLQDILKPHCFNRHYVPACQNIMEIYLLQKNNDLFVKAASIACESNFYAKGIIRFEKTAQICTKMGDALSEGKYIDGKQTLLLPIDKEQSLYLYKIGCEEDNEARACNNLEKILKNSTFQ